MSTTYTELPRPRIEFTYDDRIRGIISCNLEAEAVIYHRGSVLLRL